MWQFAIICGLFYVLLVGVTDGIAAERKARKDRKYQQDEAERLARLDGEWMDPS